MGDNAVRDNADWMELMVGRQQLLFQGRMDRVLTCSVQKKVGSTPGGPESGIRYQYATERDTCASHKLHAFAMLLAHAIGSNTNICYAMHMLFCLVLVVFRFTSFSSSQ